MTTVHKHTPRARAARCPRPPDAALAALAARSDGEFQPPSDACSTFDLDAESRRLREEPAYARTGRNAVTLSATHDHHIVLVAQRAGRRVDAHRAPSRTTIEVIAGALAVRVGDGSDATTTRLGPHGLVTIDRHVLHTIETAEDSVFLLTISGALRCD